jgi:uncharacterized protein (DUF1697 family)
MPKYIAFLRAINVGGHTVKMDYLRSLFEGLGFENVATFIASGNIIVDSPDLNTMELEQMIEGTLCSALGYTVATFLRTPAELHEIITLKPFSPVDWADPANHIYIGFLQERPAEEARMRLVNLSSLEDEFAISGREFYWLRRGRMSDSKVSGAQLERLLGLPSTLRNISTLRKLVEKVSSNSSNQSF